MISLFSCLECDLQTREAHPESQGVHVDVSILGVVRAFSSVHLRFLHDLIRNPVQQR